MPTIIKTLTAAGATSSVKINLKLFREGVGIVVHIPEGSSATYDVEVTGDDLKVTHDDDKVWNKHDILKDMDDSANSNLAYPVTAVRLKASAVTGTITMAVIQTEAG